LNPRRDLHFQKEMVFSRILLHRLIFWILQFRSRSPFQTKSRNVPRCRMPAVGMPGSLSHAAEHARHRSHREQHTLPARPSSGSSSGEGSSSTAVADSNAMAITGGSAHVGNLTQYPVCVRTKVCKLEDGQEWTKELLRQRLDVLRRVRWCLCCGEICQVRSDKDANWSDAEIMGDCHRKNTRTTNDGSAYPECNNKTGEWKSLKHNRQMMNRRAYEIRKLQRKVAKCVASAAAGQRQKKKLKKRKN
jgi:hypothetical protein